MWIVLDIRGRDLHRKGYRGDDRSLIAHVRQEISKEEASSVSVTIPLNAIGPTRRHFASKMSEKSNGIRSTSDGESSRTELKHARNQVGRRKKEEH